MDKELNDNVFKDFPRLVQRVRKISELKNWLPPNRMLSIDPGETIGIAYFESGALKQAYQENMKLLTARSLEAILERHNPHLIILEDYKIRANKSEAHINSSLFTVRLIGQIENQIELREISLQKQLPAQAKGFCTDRKLKAWNMYQEHCKHANDAVRHGCYFLLFGKY